MKTRVRRFASRLRAVLLRRHSSVRWRWPGSCAASLALVVGASAQAPANDNFANAQMLAAAGGTLTATTVGATTENGEPDHGTNTLWFTWTPTTSGNAQFNVTQTNNGMTRYVYTGNSLGGLAGIVGVWGGTEIPVVFSATAGTTYRFMVGAANASSAGPLTLSWGPTSLVRPSITTPPADVRIGEGATATFSVTATGSGVLSYTWYRVAPGESGGIWLGNDATYSGTTTATLTVANVTAAMNGTRFSCDIQSSAALPGNGAGAMLYVVPVITVQPANQSGVQGGTATFSVTATGSNLTYQWFRNGQAITGATAATLALTNLQLADVGVYFVRISNGANTVLSNAASLAGSGSPPSITAQPASVTVTSGQPATLSVSATGSGTLAYQWRRSGFPVPGATGATFTLPAASRAEADYYDVLVASGLVLTTSQRARLSVAPTSYPSTVAFDRSAALWLENANSGGILKVLPLTGGKFLVAGDFTSVNGVRRTNVARFNADGTHDATFNPPEINDRVETIAVQADGKILIGGYFWIVGGQSIQTLARLNADGSLDAAYNPNPTGPVYAIAVQAGGKILVSGDFRSILGQERNRIARLNADGTLDPAFNSPFLDTAIYRLAAQADGKVVIAGWFTSVGGVTRNRIARLNADGTLDSGFNPNADAEVYALAVQADGRILVGGYFGSMGGQSRARIARLNTDGTLDAGFNASLNGYSVQSVAVQGDGKIVLGGDFNSLGSQSRSNLARLNSDGTLDAGFNPGADSIIYSLAVPGDGTILLGGYFTKVNGQARTRIARLNADGSLAASAATLRGAGRINVLAHAAGGKFYAAGFFTHANGVGVSRNLARFNGDGTVDGTFNPAPNDEVNALLVQGDGRILVGGGFNSIGGVNRNSLARLNADGTCDASLDASVSGRVHALAVQPDGRLVLGGSFSMVAGQARNNVARVSADGTLDAAFNPNVSSSYYYPIVSYIMILEDGKILLAGGFSEVGGQGRYACARLNADGSLDATFNLNVGGSFVTTLVRQVDGKILLGGGIYEVGGQSRNNLARLNADGTVDPTFDTSFGFNSDVYAVLPQEDGRILAGGYFNALGSAANTARVARVNSNGTPDPAFQFVAGASDFRPASALLLMDNGQLWVGGFEQGGYSLARLIPLVAPTITTQPVNQTASGGATVTFSVAATGSPAPTYQWMFNGTPIAGATNATLTLANVQFAQAGTYWVTVSNSAASVNSNFVTLSGSNAAPTLTAQPQNITVTAGQPATLSVTATGTGTLGYQWRRNGVPISGATAATYTLASASRADADFYDVVVNAGLSGTTSQRARLSVTPTAYPGAVAFDRSAALWLENANASYVQRIVMLPGGKFLVAGDFVSVNGLRCTNVARFNADGSHDTSFVPVEINEGVQAMAVQADGKIMLGGYFFTVGGQPRNFLARLNPDGSLDTGYNPSPTDAIFSIVVQADGKALVGGWFSSIGGQSRNRVARLNADGTADPTFVPPSIGSGVLQMAIQADGKLVIGGYFTTVGSVTRNQIARLNTDGTLDASFDPNLDSEVDALAVQADGKILVGGYFASVGGQPRSYMARLNTNGTLDAGFAPNPDGSVWSIVIQGDGKILLGGYFGVVGGQSRGNLARVNADGTLDAGFNPAGNGYVYTVALPGDGTVLAGGSRLTKWNANGTQNGSVAPTLRAAGYIYALAPAAGGKFYAAGGFTHANGVALSSNLARFNANGTVDSTFNPAPSGPVRALAVQGDGKLVVGGGFGGIGGLKRSALARVNPDGTGDASFNVFGVGGWVYAVAVQPDGNVVFGGDFSFVGNQTRNHVARVFPDGTLDPFFNPNTNSYYSSYVSSVLVQPDGRILLGGGFSTVGEQNRSLFARVNADGTLDSTFNLNISGYAGNTLALQADGKTVLGGGFYSVGGQSRNNLARLNADGTLDLAFNTSNGFGNTVYAVLPQEDGRVLAGGYYTSFTGGGNAAAIARFNNDGSRDSAFQFGASASFRPVQALLLADNGQLWVGGYEDYGYSLARLVPTTAPAIATQPVNQTAAAGGTVTFSVTATGSPAPTYQWYFNGASLAGATNATLTLTNVQLANAGSYYVVATNGIGSVTSSTVTLGGTNAAPTITAQPQNITVVAGQSATFSVTAGGSGTLVYQWRRNGFALTGATGASYTLTNASRTDADYYDVVIAAGLSLTTSQVARLSVAPTSYPGLVVPDPAWNLQVEGYLGAGYAVVSLPDGRAYLGGAFGEVNGPRRTSIVRVLADGTPDPAFVPPEIDGVVRAIAVQPDGHVVIGGDFIRVGGAPRNRLVRLNSDGSLDPNFGNGIGASSTILALGVLPDGRLLVGGSFSNINGFNRSFLARLTADGAVDTGFLTLGFSSTVNALAIQSDGKIVVGGSFTSYLDISGVATPRTRLARLNSDGTLDAGFNSTINNTVNAVFVQIDNKVVVGGSFTSVTFNGTSTNSMTVGNVARLGGDGSLDVAFTNASGTGFNAPVNTLALQSDGKILAGGNFSSYAGTSANCFARLNTDGTRDSSTLSVGFNTTVNAIAVQASGKVVTAGFYTSYLGAANASISRWLFSRLNADGTLDSAINLNPLVYGESFTTLLLPGGKLLLAGYFSRMRSASVLANLARINADGTVDSSFNPGGSGASSYVYAAARQADGKIVVGGSFSTYNGTARNGVARLNADGTLDSGFNATGAGGSYIYTIVALPAGRTFVGGGFSAFHSVTRGRVAALNADGTLDAGFAAGAGANGTVFTAVAQPDGRIIIAGSFTSYDGVTVGNLVRLQPDGSVDSSFNPGGAGANSQIKAVALQPDGKIIVAGFFGSYNGTSRGGVARLNADGTLDPSFVPPSIGSIYSLFAQEDGKVIIRGGFTSVGGAPGTAYLARLNADGSRDATFVGAGFTAAFSTPLVIAMRDDGQIASGASTNLSYFVTRPGSAPVITTQPQNQIAAVGGSASFQVASSSSLPVAYQWFRDGTILPGATGTTLALTNLQPGQAGSYTALASNELGSVLSDAATLTGPGGAPLIATQPQSQNVTAGAAVSLSVNATGGPFTYQWRRNGLALAGATNATLSLGAATRALADVYDVVIFNGLSSVVSQPARLAVAPAAYPQVLSADASFTASFEALGGSAQAILRLPSGKAIVVGSFTRLGGTPARNIAQLNADGTVDTTFLPQTIDGTINAVAAQADGKLIIGGSFATINGISRSGLARLNADGTFDSSFFPGQGYSTTNALALQSDGKILVGGSFSSFLHRLNADGSRDTTFNPTPTSTVNALAVQGDGRILVGGQFSTIAGTSASRIARLNTDGTFDANFTVGSGFNGTVSVLRVLADGRVLAGGSFTTYKGAGANFLVRLTTLGALDTAWTPGSGPSGSVIGLDVQADGKLVLGGGFTSYNGTTRNFLARVSADGALDTTFAPAPPSTTVNAVSVLANNTILAGGTFSSAGGQSAYGLARFSADGSAVLSGFTPGFLTTASVNRVAVLGDGRILTAGAFTHVNGVAVPFLARLNANGTLDSTFNAGGSGPFNSVTDFFVQGDGRIVLTGSFLSYNGVPRARLARLAADGSLDSTFDPGGGPNTTLTRIYPLSGGRVLLVGSTSFSTYAGVPRVALARVNADGSLDPSFNAGTLDNAVLAAAVQPDEKIIVVGSFTNVNGVARNRIARLLPSGAIDGAFNADADNTINAVLLQPDGKVVVGGSFLVANGVSRTRVVRLNADGTLDNAWDGGTAPSSNVNFFAPQEDGKLGILGAFATVNNQANTGFVARLLANGALDSMVSFPNFASTPTGMAAFDDGSLLVYGSYLRAGATQRYGLIRTTSTAGPVILSQPFGGTLSAGGSILLSVTVAGGSNVTYQWSRDGVALNGANAASLTLTGAQTGDAGSYTVTISHAGGTLTSNAATVGVNASAPSVSSTGISSFGGIIPAGTHWPLTAPTLTAGSAPITYQWSRDSVSLAGATGATFNPLGWQTTDTGTYQVTLSNSLGTITSTTLTQTVAATPDWQWRFPTPQGNNLLTAVFLGGRFVATGTRGTILTSADGQAWSVGRLGVSDLITTVAYGNNLYVAAGQFGTLFTSPDAAVWTRRNSNTGADGRFFSTAPGALAFGGGRFVAVGTQGLVVTSTDGTSWSAATAITSDNLNNVAYGAGKFIALGASGRTITSTDGITWIPGSALPESVSFVAFGSGLFAAAASNYAYVSADGLTWSRRSFPSTSSVRNLQYTDVGFVAPMSATNPAEYIVSPDGQTWSRKLVGLALNSSGNALTHGAGRYVMVGNAPETLLTSADGVAWTRFGPPTSFNFLAAAASSSTVVAVGTGGTIYTSPDGLAWTSRASGTTNQLNDVTFAAGTFVAVGASGVIFTSTDGIAWLSRTSGTTSQLHGVNYVGDHFSAVGDGGVILNSGDGMSWVAGASGTTQNLYKTAAGGGAYVITGTAGTVLTSTNGSTWSLQTLSGIATTIQDVVYANGLFVLGSTGASIRTSPDGVTWTSRSHPLGAINSLAFVVGKFHALTTGNTSYATSPDGITWSPAQHGCANVLNDLVAFGGSFLAVGNAGSILAPLGPTIATQPASQIVASGAGATFTVAASGTGPFTYQWFKNGTAITGATGATYTIAGVGSGDAGTYTVAVSNAAGTTLSNAATLSVLPAVAPTITEQPKSQSVSEGASVTLNVTVSGTTPFTYQWRKGGTAIAGSTSATLTIAAVVPGDAGSYTVVVSNSAGSATSNAATLTILPPGLAATHAVSGGAGYFPGTTVTITNTIAYSGTASALGWQVLVPAGWTFVSDGGDAGSTKPPVGAVDLLEWAWTTVPPSPVTFTYTLNVPGTQTGDVQLAALAIVRISGASSAYQLLGKPDPLVVTQITTHSGDTDKNFRFSLLELTRVIELYNTRNGTSRTGCYKVDATGEDGFNPDPTRSGSTVVSLTRYHSGDSNHDGKLSLLELTRVIELYNYRSGTTRTGQYHAQINPPTEDGFAPGP